MCLYVIIQRRLWRARGHQLRTEEKRNKEREDDPQFTDSLKVAIKTTKKTTNEEQREQGVWRLSREERRSRWLSSLVLHCFSVIVYLLIQNDAFLGKVAGTLCPIGPRPVNNSCGGHGYISRFKTILLILVVSITCWFTLPSYIRFSIYYPDFSGLRGFLFLLKRKKKKKNSRRLP